MLATTYFQVSFQVLCGEPSPIITQRIQEDDMYNVIMESPYYDPYYRLPLGGGWTQGYGFFFFSGVPHAVDRNLVTLRAAVVFQGTQGRRVLPLRSFL